MGTASRRPGEQGPEAAATAVIEARMLADAKSAVLQSKEYRTAQIIAEIAGRSGSTLIGSLDEWMKAGKIFAIHYDGMDCFPFFALDAANGYRPYPALADVMAVFANHKGPWGIAIWFEALNSYLGAQVPKALLGVDPESVLAAAKMEVSMVAHG